LTISGTRGFSRKTENDETRNKQPTPELTGALKRRLMTKMLMARSVQRVVNREREYSLKRLRHRQRSFGMRHQEIDGPACKSRNVAHPLQTGMP
jgi:hypothetical protein